MQKAKPMLASDTSQYRISEYRIKDYSVFVVYNRHRSWKRLEPISRAKAALWYEVKNGHNLPVSNRREEKLNKIWLCKDRHLRVYRFPRIDIKGARLVEKVAAAFSNGRTDLLRGYLEEFQSHLFRIDKASGDFGLSWATIPRFDPSLIEKTRWIVGGFLADRTIQLIFGERGSFKSTLLLSAAKAVADGEDFLGFQTERRRVLYLDYENPANVIKARNDGLKLNLPSNRNLAIWNRFGKDPLPRPGDPALESFVANCVRETGDGPWIIFDSWSSFLKPGEGGENTGQIAPIYSHLRKLADLGAAISVLDHSRKYQADVLYGGQDKEAKCDTIHMLQVFENPIHRENSIVRVASWLKRFAPKDVGIFSFEVQSFKNESDEWQILGIKPSGDPIKEAERKRLEFMRDLISLHPDISQQELTQLAAAKEIGRDDAIQILKSNIGKFWEVRRGAHGKRCYRVLA